MNSKLLMACGLSVVHQITAQQPQDNDSQTNSSISIVEWCVPMVAVVLCFLVITAVIVYTVYRQKKYGAFCCLMPKMRYRVGTSEEVGGGESFDRHDYPSPPPSYDMSHTHTHIIAPPEYQDALQDVLLDSGDRNPAHASETVLPDTRFTTWSNVVIGGTPPDYTTATSTAVLNTESDSQETLQQTTPGDNSSSTSSTNSLPYATTTSSLTVNLTSSEEITGTLLLPYSPSAPVAAWEN